MLGRARLYLRRGFSGEDGGGSAARKGTSSIVASPVLVGAVTVLIIIVSVFLAYNANQGLPFVPTYQLQAQIPSGANLVKGNEVRIGGFRVGVVDAVDTQTVEEDGQSKAIAVLDLKLDKKVEPLATDTQIIVRTRSALGLKYVELTPGTAETTYAAGDTIPLANAGEPVEFDDLLNTFDDRMRDDSRTALTGYGDALAGRGQSLNIAFQELPDFLTSLTNVMDTLNDDSTQLDQFFVQIGRASAQVAPVAEVQANLFTDMADTFEALSRDPEALQATIEAAPPTLDEGIQSFPVQRPFLADFAELSDRLRPAAQELPRSLPVINSALVRGQEVLPRTVTLNQNLETAFRGLEDLAQDPNTDLAFEDLTMTVDAGAPALQFIGPYQSVCNYAVSFFNPLGEHISEQVGGGTSERIELASDNRGAPYGPTGPNPPVQRNVLSTSESSRPASIPPDRGADDIYAEDPPDAPPTGPFVRQHALPFGPAVDPRGSGKADCQGGQFGYFKGPLTSGSRYTNKENGGRFVIQDSDRPGLAGPTFTGVPSLGKVDRGHRNSIRNAP